MLDEKTMLIDRLQGDLNEQESKIAQYAEAQVKNVELEKQINNSVTELNVVKQQLETELNRAYSESLKACTNYVVIIKSLKNNDKINFRA